VKKFKGCNLLERIKAAIMPRVLLLFLFATVTIFAQGEAEMLRDQLLAETPIVEDLHELCDQIGGRVTGTEPNERAIEWAMKKMEATGVRTWKEPIRMPRRWHEKAASAAITGGSEWNPRVTCRAFSTGTTAEGMTTDLVFVGKGEHEDFEKAGDVRGKFVLIETKVMSNLTELFLEYINAIEVEDNAKEAGALGIVYMSSREKKLLYRHLTSWGPKTDMPVIVMARDDATRCKRLLKRGKSLEMTLKIDVIDEGPYVSYNVFGEIPGSENPEEIMLLGAHLDSWGLGTGANDNGCNVNMLIDIARQMNKLGLQPKRTIRFALWNGEEQGMLGSRDYTQLHKDELDQHLMAISIDIGSGKIDGFFTNGQPELRKEVAAACELLGPDFDWQHSDGVIVGTDNYDFFAQGLPNMVGKHDVYNYCADYHSESDTFDKVNQKNLKENTALLGVLMWNIANQEEWNYPRKTRSEIQAIIAQQELESGMRALNLWEGWEDGSRGLK